MKKRRWTRRLVFLYFMAGHTAKATARRFGLTEAFVEKIVRGWPGAPK